MERREFLVNVRDAAKPQCLSRRRDRINIQLRRRCTSTLNSRGFHCSLVALASAAGIDACRLRVMLRR